MAQLKYYISALYLSLFSRKFYARLINNSNILGVRYLLVVALVVAVPVSLEIKYVIANMFSASGVSNDENLDYIATQVPDIFIRNGQIKTSLKANQPILSKNGEMIAMFDVENKINDMQGYERTAIVNEEGVRFNVSEGSETMVVITSEIERALEQYLEPQPDGVQKLNKVKLFEDIKQIIKTPFLLIAILSMLLFFVKYLFSALAYSFVVGIMLASVSKSNPFEFRQCFRVAAFTATPVALLEMVSNLLGGGLFTHASLVYFITHMIYIHFAVESYKNLTRKV